MSERSIGEGETGVPTRERAMRVGAGQFMQPTESRLRYIRQLGVEDVVLNMYQYDPEYEHMPDAERMPLVGEAWPVGELVDLRERIEAAGLRLAAIENVPIAFYEDVMLGREGRDEQLDRLETIIRNLGEAGIGMFGYHWSPTGVWRTGTERVRGDAAVSAFDAEDADDELVYDRAYTEDELWTNYEYFLERVVPVAEEAGVKLCLHPNDPPVESLGGVPMLFRDFERFKRAMETVPSEYHGLDLCLGCWSQMGADLDEVITHFGSREEIFYVHFRDVEGTVPSFREAWVDEGNYDALEVLRSLDEVGFSGVMIPDHTPHVDDDTDWDHRGRAFTIGHLKGLLRCVRSDDAVA